MHSNRSHDARRSIGAGRPPAPDGPLPMSYAAPAEGGTSRCDWVGDEIGLRLGGELVRADPVAKLFDLAAAAASAGKDEGEVRLLGLSLSDAACQGEP